jgi:multidrug efflux pump subunit AcrA (membrane-fusion protein)
MLEQLMDASVGVYGVRVPAGENTARYNRLEQAEKLRIDAEHLQFLQGLGAVSLDWIVLDDTKKAEKRASSVGLPKEMSRLQREAEQQAKKAEQQAKKAEQQQAKKAEQQAKKAEQQAKKAEASKMVEWPEELGVYAGKVAWDDLTTKQRRDKIRNEKWKFKKTIKWPEEELGVYAGPPAWDELDNRQRETKIVNLRQKLGRQRSRYERDKSMKTVKWPEGELGVYAGKVAWDDLVDTQRKSKIGYAREKLKGGMSRYERGKLKKTAAAGGGGEGA